MTRQVWFMVVCGVIIVMVGGGIRQIFGVFQVPITLNLDIGRDFFGLVIAAQALLYGVSQPVAGLLADRYGSIRVIVAGTILYALGLWWTTVSTTPMDLFLSLGLLVGLGLSGPTQVLVLGAVGKVVPNEYRSLVFGTVIAASSFGMFFFVPGAQKLVDALGWRETFVVIALILAVLPFIVIGLRGAPEIESGGPKQSWREAIGEARSHSGYILLTLGFFVCGFHVTFIQTHLPAYVTDLGLAASVGAKRRELESLDAKLGGMLVFLNAGEGETHLSAPVADALLGLCVAADAGDAQNVNAYLLHISTHYWEEVAYWFPALKRLTRL